MLNVHNSVNSIAFSRDGKLLATASRDHKVRFWKPDTGTEATELAIDHSTPINSVAFSKDTDSKLVALASDDTNIVVYNVPENRQLATLEGHQKWVTEVVFSPHNKYLVSGSGDKTVRIWDIPTGLISETKVSSGSTISPQRTLEVHGGPVNSVASSPTDCGLFASASEDRTVMIWNIETKETKPILTGHSEAVNSIAFSPDGQLLASASDDGTVRLWNVELGVPYGVFKGHSSWIRDISFSSDGQLASASDDKTIKIWDPKMGEIQRLYDEHLYSVTAVAFSPTKHQWYASASEDQTIKLWDRETGAVFATLEGHSNTVNSVRFSPNGELLASCSDDNTIRLWKTNNIEASRKEDKIVKEEAYRLFQGHISEVNSIAFSPDNRLVVSGSSDNRVIIWDIETKKKLTIIRHSHTVRVVAASYNCATGQLLIASASNDHKIKLWRKVKEVPNSNSETLCCYEDWIKTLKFSTDAEENPDSEPERLFPEHGDWVRAIAFSNDGQLLASGSDDNKVRVWSTEKEACVHYATFDSHFDWIRTVIFTPNKELLLSGSDDGTIILWDLAKRLKRATLKGHSAQVNSIDVSSDSQLLVSASNDATVKIWDIKTSEASTLEKHSDNVVAAVFSPDDEQIVSISDDKTVKLWGTKRRELLTPADGDLDPIKKIEFSNKLDRVVSLSEDGVIRFWDLTGKPQNMLKGELDGANCISFSPDGASLVSGSNDNKVRLWDTSTGTGKVANTRNAHLGAVNCIAFLTLPGTPGPKQIVVSGSDDTTIRIWKMEKGNLSMEGVLTGHYDRINSIAYSSRSNLLASASDDKRVMIWNIGKEEPNFEAKFVLVHPSEVKFVDFSGERIVSTSKDNKVWIWDTAKGTLHASLEGQESLVTAIAISPDERFVATASEDNMVKIWSFKRGRVEVPIEKVPAYGPIRKLSFPERGSFLTTDRGPLRPTSLREIGALTSLTDSLPLSEFYVGMEWITRGAAHILRIPLEYQPSTVAIQDKLAIVGLRSGSLLFLTIDLNKVR
jgi:WD40 repeat protein